MALGVGDPVFVTYDPVWEDGDPVTVDYPDGYRTVVSIFASPSYHPNTMILLVMDNEEYAESRPAVGRRSALTGLWETSGMSDQVVLLDYGDGPGVGAPDDYLCPVFWPPTSDKLYLIRWDEAGGDGDFWWVEIDATYPFTFSKRSDTPGDKGLAGEVWGQLWSFTSNADASMLCAFHRGEFDVPFIARWSMWAPGPNIVSYFKGTDAAFAGLWDDDSIPSAAIIDKNDHLWIITAIVVTDSPGQLYFDEFSWTVGGSDITLTHLNRYELINQDGGFNTWTYDLGAGPFSEGGVTYNEDTDSIIIHWQCRSASAVNTNHDPPDDFAGASQNRITIWDLATRTKKLSEADSVLLTDAADSSLLGTAKTEQSGRDAFLGTMLNQKGDRMFGTWTKQDWTVYAAKRTGAGDSQHDGFYVVDIATGIGTKYGPDVWPDFLVFDAGDEPGVYSFAGAILEPVTEKFWAGRRNEANAGHFVGSAFYYTSDGLGIYGWESDASSGESCPSSGFDLVYPPCVTAWTQCVKIQRRDGVSFRFTSLDQDIEFRGETYVTCGGLDPSATQVTAQTGEVGSSELAGLMVATGVKETELYGGLFDDAFVEIWLVPFDGAFDTADANIPRRLAAGWAGKVSHSTRGYKMEVLGPGARLDQRPIVQAYSPQCRWVFGDERCGVDIESLAIVGTVTSPFNRGSFIASLGPEASSGTGAAASSGELTAQFSNGRVRWLTGINAGQTTEVKSVDFDTGQIILWALTCFVPEAGDSFDLLPGCAQDFATCRDLYDNAAAFGGFPHVPGRDAVSETPNAKV